MSRRKSRGSSDVAALGISLGGDFINQEFAEKMIDSALAEVSSGL
jgi:hypothetical protein